MTNRKPPQLRFRPAEPRDGPECVSLRGQTRENAFSAEQLRAIGVTAESWADNIRSGALPGFVCTSSDRMVGYCFGSRETGEIEVLAVLPDFEDQGIGRELLSRTLAELRAIGHRRAFLGCSPDPASRSYGFYRHLGWRSTNTFDKYGDEVLELDLL